jgi:hypothetical protein
MKNSGEIIVIVAILILCFAGMSFSSNKDENLLKQASQIFGSLPNAIVSETNPITPEKVKLGKILFYECQILCVLTTPAARQEDINLW